MTLLLIGLAIAVVLVMWLTWTATRIDRLNARCEAAWSSLDAQLVRRAAASRAIAEECGDAVPSDQAASLRSASAIAIQAQRDVRAVAENALSAVLTQVDGGPLWVSENGPNALGEFREACTRVRMARTFYNGAVRDSRSLRGQWLPRVTGLGRKHALPEFFDIDDTPGLRA